MIEARPCKNCGNEMRVGRSEQYLCGVPCANEWMQKQRDAKIDPRLLEIIKDGHTEPMHSGWKLFCPTCQKLKAFVDALTSINTNWAKAEGG